MLLIVVPIVALLPGEIWEAAAGARAGETVRIARLDGLTLEVERAV